MNRKYIDNLDYYQKSDTDAITVDQLEGWKTAQAPLTIETTPLTPCVGVIIYDPINKQAMVGHFVDPRCANGLDRMIKEVLQKFSDKKNLKIWIGGGSFDLEDAPHFIDDIKIRIFTIETIKNHGFENSQVTTKWLSYNEAQIMRIDTSTGIVEYLEELENEALMDEGSGNVTESAIAHQLLGEGVDINAALTCAAETGYDYIVRLLLIRGANVDVNANTPSGTALMRAAKRGYLDIVQLLLDYGANPEIKDVNGKKALEFAQENNHQNVVDLLSEWGMRKLKKLD